MVANDTEAEDGEGEDIAAVVGGAEDLSEGMVRVFKASDGVPEERVEYYGAGGD